MAKSLATFIVLFLIMVVYTGFFSHDLRAAYISLISLLIFFVWNMKLREDNEEKDRQITMLRNINIQDKNFDPGCQIRIIWSTQDVLHEDVRPDLTEEQAMDVLLDVENAHDANYGICWETLRQSADNLFPKVNEDV